MRPKVSKVKARIIKQQAIEAEVVNREEVGLEANSRHLARLLARIGSDCEVLALLKIVKVISILILSAQSGSNKDSYHSLL